MNSWPSSRCVEKAKRTEQDSASEDYPSIDLGCGHALHVYKDDCDEWHVWLNTEVSDFDGLCIATGCKTRDDAIREGVRVFEAAEAALQGPA